MRHMTTNFPTRRKPRHRASIFRRRLLVLLAVLVLGVALGAALDDGITITTTTQEQTP